VLAVIVVGVVLALNWDVFVRGKRGPARAWSLAAGFAAALAGILQGAEVDRPWPLVALMVFVALQVVAFRAERRMERTERPEAAGASSASSGLK
jgi:4-hydroxybenzoate polyprenyltransferase